MGASTLKVPTLSALALSISAFSTVAQADPQSQDYIPLTLKGSSAQRKPAASSTARACPAAPATGTPANALHAPRCGSTTRATAPATPPTAGKTGCRHHPQLQLRFHPRHRGFAVEAAGYNAIALQQSREAIAGPNNRTLTHSDGDPVGQWSKLGLGNIKARVSNTTLTLGRQSVDTPMIAYIGNRALPSSFQARSCTAPSSTT